LGLHDQWYENAIIYCLDVETFADGNGDGIGDFDGLTARLDYLSGLGVTCLWLMPFYPSPGGDDGYDISDYAAIDPRYDDMTDFAEFLHEAKERGLRVVIDLVPNHTSNEHRWFQAARSDPDSPYRDYYVWRTDDPGDTSDQVIFPGEQEGIWTWDDQAGAWYLHHFYDFQPDLNYANPAVRDEFRKIIGLWLDLGVSGFRVDAAPFLIKVEDANGDGMRMAHEFLAELGQFAQYRQGDAILLGEVDEGLSTIADYFGGGSELEALFNFPLNRFLFLGLAQESADPIRFGLDQLPTIPGSGQWVNFLRHHDELNLSRLTMDQRQQVMAAFGPDPDFQVYDRGLRRRLAPMLGGDQKRIRMAYSLLFGMPGTPMIFYGEEIGMGEQLSLPGRMSVRAPMQWTSYGTGGFSTAPPAELVRPMNTDGEYGFSRVSVSSSRADPDSLLNFMASLTRVRRECGAIGTGTRQAIETGRDAVLGLRYDAGDAEIMVFNNLSGARCTFDLDLGADQVETLTDLICDRAYEAMDPDRPRMRMEGYGYRWLRIEKVAAAKG
jgi:maltose alpha-D-glucosyltransferase/alpha-amylase